MLFWCLFPIKTIRVHSSADFLCRWTISVSSLAVLFTVLSTGISSTRLSQFLSATVWISCSLFSVKQCSGPLKVTGKFELFWEGATSFLHSQVFQYWLVPHNLTSLCSLSCTHWTLLFHWPLSYGCVYCDVFYCVYFHCMVYFWYNYHGFCVFVHLLSKFTTPFLLFYPPFFSNAPNLNANVTPPMSFFLI